MSDPIVSVPGSSVVNAGVGDPLADAGGVVVVPPPVSDFLEQADATSTNTESSATAPSQRLLMCSSFPLGRPRTEARRRPFGFSRQNLRSGTADRCGQPPGRRDDSPVPSLLQDRVQELLGLRVPGVLEDLLRGALLEDDPVVEEQHPMRDLA